MKRLKFIAILVVVICTSFIVNAVADDFYVIPVNNKCGPCKGTRSEGGRWCDNGDGTVTDMKTCLVWLKYAAWGGEKKWRSNTVDDYDDAHTRASGLKDGTVVEGLYGKLTDGSVVGDWRLPTLSEFFGIMGGIEHVSTVTPGFFVGLQSSGYWSSTTTAWDISKAGQVWFNSGSGVIGKATSHYVWPVRMAR